MNERSRPQVVVVGGGYAGAMAAVRLAGRARSRVDVTLIEPRSELIQRLRLHQVATGQRIPSYPLAKITGRRVVNADGRASEIDADASIVRVQTKNGSREIDFDHLILATGSTIDTDSVPGVRAHSHSLADPDSANKLHGELNGLEEGSSVLVCGAGMTGLEMASELAEARPDLNVRLVSARPLGDWLSGLGRERLFDRLEHFGIEVIDSSPVAALEERHLVLADDRELSFDLAVWCGGFVSQPLAWESGLDTNGRGALVVDSTLRSPTHSNIVGAGDAAAIPELPNGAAFRMTCQAGMPAGAHAADTVLAMLKGEEPEEFDFGYIHQPISLGRHDGLIQWVDRADRPRDKVWSGRRAAIYKELVTRSAVPSIRMEKRLPGMLRWPSGGAPTISPVAQLREENADLTSPHVGGR